MIVCTSDDILQCNRELLQALRAEGYTILEAELVTSVDGYDSNGPKAFIYTARVVMKKGIEMVFTEYEREKRFQNNVDDRTWMLTTNQLPLQ